ncbi:MAG TPA: DNA translocase FtsK 4TM domain-containing protein, partial [Albidovulum sp.]|uniref:DNA translocase FtsK 4TM domain-containing protein n=1 Tax=Albidovulum sp. TaxID=1872424 RepID=UPI002D179902|nr:DNA translocase FtsK 4TM domain-containing protein [Albidovulum sp.]
MASYQARQRDPLLDQNMQAAIERRGKELLGAGLLVLGLLTALMLVSYSPDDPSWLAATDQPARNILGQFGAAIASPLFVIAGKGAWMIALTFIAWGVRLVTHRGEERALGRVIFAPIAVAMASVYASTLVAGPEWVHSFGLGGLFGDTVLGALLGVLPVGAAFGLKFLSLILGIGALATAIFVLGFDARELRVIGRFLLVGTIVAYDWALRLAGRGAEASVRGAQALHERNQSRRAARGDAADDDFHVTEPPMRGATQAAQRRAHVMRADARYGAAEPEPAVPQPKKGFLARVTDLARRGVEPRMEPELVESHLPRSAWNTEAPTEERIRARIADAVKSRGQTGPGEVIRTEPPLNSAMRAARAAAPVATAAAPALAVEPRFLRAAPQIPVPAMDAAGDDFAADPIFADDDDDNIFADTPDTAPQRPLVQHVAKKSLPSKQALCEAQPRLKFEEKAPAYEIPPLSLLASPTSVQRRPLSDESLEENARMLESVLDDYGVKGEITSVRPGPVVTMYELEPAPGLKASRVIGLADDIARSMSALSARVSTVPGRTVIGIELPNAFREKVVLREILSAREYGDSNLRLPLALGKDIAGEPVIANLAKMPHLLIAGTTGSGKSVAINTMILSLLYKLTPEECRLIMIDPKML